jgi:TatD DNase family protein
MFTQSMELIDTHCHLDIKAFAQEFKILLARAVNSGVEGIVLPGVDQEGWGRMLDLCRDAKRLFAAPGLHPMYLSLHRPHHLEELTVLTSQETLVAIGEIGLDYYIEDADRDAQQRLVEHQLQIARHAHLPVLLHVRKAHDRVLATLRAKRFSHGGIVHAYNGSYQQATEYIKLGFAISMCGTLTYERAKKIRAIAARLPREAIVLETDAPDIPLAGRRGENNLPEYLPEILEVLANIRNEDPQDTACYTTANAKRILGLPL